MANIPHAYGVNEHGQTYGSMADSPSPDQEPDLILVMTVEGGEGYVYREDLNGPQPSSVEEAMRVSELNAQGRTITAYAPDGTTMLGTFQIGGQGMTTTAW